MADIPYARYSTMPQGGAMETTPEPPDRDLIAKVTSLIQGALDSWPKTPRLCLVLAAIALVLAAWNA
jgi:hypothetical protein